MHNISNYWNLAAVRKANYTQIHLASLHMYRLEEYLVYDYNFRLNNSVNRSSMRKSCLRVMMHAEQLLIALARGATPFVRRI